MLHVSVIGSCRVHNPVLAMRDRNLLRVNINLLTAYTHQTHDCFQQLKIREDLMTVPEPVSALVFDKPVPLADQAKFMGPLPPHETDVAVIEICTLKVFSFDGIYTQDNHCKRHIADHLNSEKDAELWWREVHAIRNQDLIDGVLPAKLPSAMAEAARHLRMTLQTPDEIIAGMKEIAALIRIPVLWVSHNRLHKGNGESIPQRETVAAAVCEGAARLGHRYLDPTDAVESYGQEKAMQEDGKNLNEYAREFLPFYGAVILDELKGLLQRS